jgi:hypothetical protein
MKKQDNSHMMADFLNSVLFLLSLTLNTQRHSSYEDLEVWTTTLKKKVWTTFLVFYHGLTIRRCKGEAT